MDSTIYIPANYTDAGKVFGMFEIRNVAECAILCIPITILCIMLSPLNLTGTLILLLVLDIPIGGFALMGVQDDSLFSFVRCYRRYRKNRRILLYRGSQWVRKKV